MQKITTFFMFEGKAEEAMNASSSSKKSRLLFFVLVFALSIPFWLIGAAARGGLPLPINLPVSALMFVCPIIAASILVYREDKLCGVRKILKRIFDYARIKPKIWYLPIIFLVAYQLFDIVLGHAPDGAATPKTAHFIHGDTYIFCSVLYHCCM